MLCGSVPSLHGWDLPSENLGEVNGGCSGAVSSVPHLVALGGHTGVPQQQVVLSTASHPWGLCVPVPSAGGWLRCPTGAHSADVWVQALGHRSLHHITTHWHLCPPWALGGRGCCRWGLSMVNPLQPPAAGAVKGSFNQRQFDASLIPGLIIGSGSSAAPPSMCSTRPHGAAGVGSASVGRGSIVEPSVGVMGGSGILGLLALPVCVRGLFSFRTNTALRV